MSRPILTAAAIRAAEKAAIDGGTSEQTLMERAGAALAEAASRFVGPRDTLVLCGPGNNGGDGYIAARLLAEAGFAVRVAALADPTTDAARTARKGWTGPVEPFADAQPAALLIDCLFGTGFKRALEPTVSEKLFALVSQSAAAIAADLPSGIPSDGGATLSPIGTYDLTVAFGALKPAHRLVPAMVHMGRVVLADIGLDTTSDWFELAQPSLPALDPLGHKFSRGLVHCLAGKMPGAIALSANAAARTGAGYVRVSTSLAIDNLPAAVVQTDTAIVNDDRIGAILVGPGLGDIPQILTLALTATRPVVIDADAIGHIGEPERLRGHDAIITPHDGEFAKLFPGLEGDKPTRTLAAAAATRAVVVYKGPDTLIAAPDGRLAFAPPAPPWLATAGTGDVLAGMIAALRARGLLSFDAACAAVWLHGRAAEQAGPGMIADDLVRAIPRVITDLA